MMASESSHDLEVTIKPQATNALPEDCGSIASNSSAASRKRKAELHLRFIREKQELERSAKEAERELELRKAMHELELAAVDLEDEEAIYLPERQNDSITKVKNYLNDIPSKNNDNQCSNILFNAQDIHSLPKPDILTFDGNPADYCKFISNFEANIEARVTDPKLRLNYLIQFCKGDARFCIEDCVILSPDEGYIRARHILKSRYGKPHLVARSHVDSLIHGNIIKSNDVQGLLNLSLHMEKCQMTLSQLGYMSDINNTENLRKIVRRLPLHIKSRWVERASTLIEQGLEPNFDNLLTFVKERSNVANTMYGHDLANESGKHSTQSTKNSHINQPQRSKVINAHVNPSQHSKMTTLVTHSDRGNMISEKYHRGKLSCIYCRNAHKLKDCPQFKLIDLDSKLAVIKKHEMCKNCMNFKHVAENCRARSLCEVSGCTGKHNTMFHRDAAHKGEYNNVQEKTVAASNSRHNQVSLRIVPVVVGTNSGTKVETYALLDEGSDVTLCSDSLVKRLGVESKPCKFTLTTVNKTRQKVNGRELQLQVSALNGGLVIDFPKVWSVNALPISLQPLPDQSVTGKWEHLSGIHLPRINVDKVELLIGSDCPEAFWVEEERRGLRGEPYAIRSPLGWTILGPTGISTSAQASVNFHYSSHVQEDIDKLWSTDFLDCGRDNKVGMSREDHHALSKMEASKEMEGRNLKLCLPWRDEQVSLPNNKVAAVARLQQLSRKLAKDSTLHNMYSETMKGYIEKGYAKLVKDSGEYNKGKVWYLPHHPVMNPNKPGKVRIVFDCAAKYHGTSLNDNLMQGPDLVNSLVGVLIRFREQPVALVADIEAMFHQVKVSDKDRDALRFLWWPDGNMKLPPAEYCMTVHLFGATSSPSCAAFSLRCTARENASEFSPDAVRTVERNFYVDDLLKSVSDEQVAIKLSSELRELLSRGGFKLTKWISNSKEVLATIPETDRTGTYTNVDLENDKSLERALGLQWNVQRDNFVFDVDLPDKCHTRRGILSVASSLFDPLGLVAPVTLIPKIILQNACRQKLQWDDQMCETDVQKWSKWLECLPVISQVSIDRCFQSSLINDSLKTELHMFSDASEYAYGAAVYIKIYDVNGNCKCSLVIGKSRLAPIKTMSIPRLELAAAVVAVQLYQFVSQELDLKVDEKYFWTDSMIVLGYINNETRRFKTFVANRLAVIHDVTMPKDWRYVPSEMNPADIASRGLFPNEIDKLEYWLRGPDFLLSGKEHWPQSPVSVAILDDDTEIKQVCSTHAIQMKSDTCLDKLLSKYSDWYQLQRSVAWLLRFKSFIMEKCCQQKRAHCKLSTLTVRDLRAATKAIMLLVQTGEYSSEIASVKKLGHVSGKSSLAKLSPVFSDGLLKVGGRLNNSQLCNDTKHQVILPGNHHVTRILIRSFHETNAHMGAHHVLSLTRQRYWITPGLRSVKSVIRKCIDCKRRQPQRPEVQQMSNLPEERLTPDKAPFTYVGVDYFGPMTVKSGRRHLKRYGCLFTCLTTRAVHIEIAHSLDTDSFICALRRFISRRGCPERIFSDNGTNFTSGEKVLRDNVRQFNQSRLAKFCQQQEINWHFNPPYASHMGGVWERLVRSVKRALKSVVREQLLNDEALLTLMAEVEKILNDRPITQVSSDQRDPEPLSPNKLLLMRSNASLPPGIFNKHDVYSKRWWRQTQYLAGVFWKRWLREYLPSLQVRQKWFNLTRNVTVNDLVLVCDERSSQGKWPLGKVLEVNKGRDGLVRSCKVRVNGSVKVRPITVLSVLEQEE